MRANGSEAAMVAIMDLLLEFGRAPFLIAGVCVSLLFGVIIMTVLTQIELNRVRNGYNDLLEYLGDGRSRDIVHDMTSLLRNIERDNQSAEKDIARLYELLSGCIRKVGVVRYNAFHNVGSDQSYSVAMLDSDENGVVFSGIYGRESSTTYAKPIKAGVSDYVLTEEEENAIALACKNYTDIT